MRDASNVAGGTWRHTVMKVGAGGHNTSIATADDGTLVTRTDTFNAQVRGPSAAGWTQLIRTGDNYLFPLTDPFASDAGTTAIDICATDSSIIYAWFDGYICKTTDGGATLTRTAFTRYVGDDLRPNSGQRRLAGNPMVVDPINGSVVWAGTGSGGVSYTADGGATWNSISTATLPLPTANTRYTFCFDRTSAQTGGKTQGLLVGIPGSGIYRTTNAGTTWAIIASAPAAVTTGVNFIYVHPTTGNIYTAGDGAGFEGQLHRYIGGTWSAPATATAISSIAMKPTDNTKMYAFNGGGSYRFSSDNGATWGSPQAPSRAATDIGWLAWTNENFMGHSASRYMPTADRLIIAEGIGVWKVDSPPTSGNWTATEISKGIENLSSIQVVGLDGGALLAALDRAFFARTKAQLQSFPSTHGPNSVDNITHGTCIDYAIDNHDFLVGISHDQNNTAKTDLFKSTDRGKTWSKFATDFKTVGGASIVGGNVAVGNQNNIVAIGAQNGGHPVYTLDGGQTWNNCNIAGNTNSGWLNAYNYLRQILIADKEVPGTFYIYNAGIPGLYKTTDGGANWAQKRSSVIASNSNFHGTLLKPLGQPNHLWWASGDDGDGLYKSIDDGVTFTKITNTTETFKFGFGVPKPGGTYPTILSYMYLSGTLGWYFSEDGGSTWSTAFTAANPPGGIYTYPVSIDGCDQVYGRFFIAWSGGNYGYVDKVDTAIS